MASLQEQYLEAMRQSQEAVVNAIGSWTKTVQQTVGQAAPTPPVEPSQIIDQVFDFAEKMLEMQRDFAKSLAAASASATRTPRPQAGEGETEG